MVYNNREKVEQKLNQFIDKLNEFEDKIPDHYKLSATEGVNNKKERQLRNDYITEIVNNI